MFGKNEQIGRSFFKEAPKDSLLVVSCFMTLQGEGPYRGHRAVFQRLAKCQLACQMCDTYFDSGTWVNYDDLLKRGMDAFTSEVEGHPLAWDSYKHLKLDCGLVITGGEPTLQKNLSAYLRLALQKFKWVQIESNGILLLEDMPDEVCLVVSPKCAEKDGKIFNYLKPSSKVLTRADCLKFVMSAEKGSYSSVPDWAHQWAEDNPNKEVFVSPMNMYLKQPLRTKDMSIEERSKVDEVISFWEDGLLDKEANQKNHEYAARYAMKHGFTFQMQEHLFAGLA